MVGALRGTDAVREDAVVRADGLGKRYGARTVLRDVSFELESGGMLLLTGPNGSGKTTLLRLLVGLAAPTRGSLELCVDRSRIGFLGHESLLYADLSALENLELYGRLYRVRERRERIGMLLERFGLWDARTQRVASLSRGMVQRLALCRTLLHEPDVLVLDEPHSALDAEGAGLFDRLLAELEPRRTVVVATHEPARLDMLATARLALGGT